VEVARLKDCYVRSLVVVCTVRLGSPVVIVDWRCWPWCSVCCLSSRRALQVRGINVCRFSWVLLRLRGVSTLRLKFNRLWGLS
jgi:hypothetical protein